MRLLVPFLAVFLGICSTATAGGKGQTLVGVVVSEAINMPTGEALALADELAVSLGQQMEVGTLGASATARRLPVGGVPSDCARNVDCLKDIGQRLGVDELLFVILVRVGQQTQVDTSWVEIKSGLAAPSASFSFEGGLEAARQAFRKHGPTLLPRALKRTIQLKTDAPATTITTTGKKPLGVAFWTSAGVGVAALGAWFALGYLPNPDDAAVDSGQRVAFDLVMGSITGVASAAALYFFFSRDEVSEPAPLLGVTADANSLGLTVLGRF